MKTHLYSKTTRQEPLADLTSRLRKRSRRVTGPRQAILEILRQHAHPLTNKEIFAAMPKRNCDLATIYRSMHLLEEVFWRLPSVPAAVTAKQLARFRDN